MQFPYFGKVVQNGNGKTNGEMRLWFPVTHERFTYTSAALKSSAAGDIKPEEDNMNLMSRSGGAFINRRGESVKCVGL